METAGSGWWRRHGWTVALLFSAFGIAILVRTVFMAQIIELWGPLNVYGGGSDSFYHSRVMSFIVNNHQNLVRDPLLNYPVGAVNPREPLFDWMNAVLGILFAPFFGGSSIVAGAWFLDAGGPIWAALGVFPVYLIGREASGRRMGIIAAFLYPLMIANIDSSTFGYANYLAFYTFFILLTIYGYIRTVKAVGSHRWVSSYRSPRAIIAGLRAFFRTERTAVKWAVFTGVCFGTLALAWQGFTYFVAIVVIFLAVGLVIERIRKIDSFGTYVATWVVGLVGFPMAAPYYIPQGLFNGWFDLPLLLFFGVLLILLPFLVLRDTPWVLSVPVLAGISAAALLALDLLNRTFFLDIVTGQGYFVKTLVYSTVAEAQAPSIDQLILGYGVVTFFLAFVGLALYVYGAARARVRRVQLVFLVFAIVSVYLPISAAKFFFLGSAAFALLAAEAIVRVIDVGGYDQLRRNAASLADRRSQFAAFRRAFKIRHVLVMLLLVVLVLPNLWYAVDAGIPYNSKAQYNSQIYNTLPSFLRVSPQNSSSFYLGAAGTQLDTPDQYDESGYNWLSQQDQNLPPPQRPAFVSWWDYGFQAVAQGGHPTVADNFQNGIDPAGNFLLAQNESQGIGVLATRLLTAEQAATGDKYLPPALNAVLARDGVNVTELHTLIVNTSQDVPLVLSHPDRYLPVDANHLDPTNAMYMATAWFLGTTLTPNGVAQVYNDIQTYTGWSIRYAMVDSRLFPASGFSTGIFYAPADLTDRIIGPGGVPTTYFSVTVTGSDGGTYPLGLTPAGVTAVSYNIAYTSAFYNTMLYHIFAGYNASEVGQTQGRIPGLDLNDPVMPGWMMEHFRVVYETAYYCPYSNPATHPGCFHAVNMIDGRTLQKQQNGSLDTSAGLYYGTQGGGGETMLEYYPGQPMVGTVSLPSGTPVPNARVTVYDEWGIPHMSTLTAPDGSYSVILPPGSDYVNVTTGVVNQLNQAGSTTLVSIHVDEPDALAGHPGAPTLFRPIVLKPATVQGFVYWNAANNSSYIPHIDPLVTGASVVLWGHGVVPRTLTTDASGAFVFASVPPGVYNMSIRYQGANFSEPQLFLGNGQVSNATQGLTPAGVSGKVFLPGSGFGAVGATVTVTGPTGLSTTAVTNASGFYALHTLPSGNYSISASLAAQGLGSVPVTATLIPGPKPVVTNITLAPVTEVDFIVLSNGNPVPGIPVRITPITPLLASASTGRAGNGTGPPPVTGSSTPTSALQNSTVLTSDATGLVRVTLPAGNYTVYGLGLLGSQWMAGLESAYLPRGVPFLTLAPLVLSPAIRVGGQVLGGNGPSTVHVYAYDPRGDRVVGSLNASSGYAFYLPGGVYTLLAVQPPPGGGPVGTNLVAMENITLSYPRTVDLPLGPAIAFSTTVGETTFESGPGFYPATGAQVRVTLSSGGQLTGLTDSNGNVSFALPQSIPSGASYCVNAEAFGFTSFTSCGLTPAQLASQVQLPMKLTPVPVNLTVVGLPSNTPITVNFTAQSITATTTSATGGPVFHLTVAPGSYRLSAWATVPSSSGLYLPPAAVNETIPIGSSLSTVVLSVVRHVASSGHLLLPAGLANSSVIVHLLSPMGNFTVSGSTFETSFLAPPGTYSVYASGTVNNGSETNRSVTYATLTQVTVNATGAITPAVVLSEPASHLTGGVSLPTGGPMNDTVGFFFIGPNNLTVPETASGGFYSAVLPANQTWYPVLNTTQLVSVGGTTQFEELSVAPGTTCSSAFPGGTCNLPLVGTPLRTTLAGSLVYPGYPGTLSGSVRLTGPLPGTATVSVAAPDGTFSVSLLPGSYQLYASVGGAAGPLANLSTVSVSAATGAPITVRLATTWTDTVTVTPPSGDGIGPVTLNVSGPNGLALTVAGVEPGVPMPLALPAGLYTLSATASGSPYGVPASATAQATVPLFSGNAATVLPLTFTLRPQVSVTILPPTSVSLGNGGTFEVGFVARNTGNAPTLVHFVGSPANWNFTFRPANASLGVLLGNSSVSGTVSIVVPAGTLATPPPAFIQAFSSANTALATSNSLTVSLAPRIGLAIGSESSGTVVGPTVGTISFWMENPGNVPLSVALSVENAGDLAALGWTATFQQSAKPLLGLTQIPVQTNQSYAVRLSAVTGHALYPSTVTVAALATNGSLWLTKTLVLHVPLLTISFNSTGLVVTGPNVGSPATFPDWLVPLLVFVPAIAFVVVLLVNRWYRTRRWTRR